MPGAPYSITLACINAERTSAMQIIYRTGLYESPYVKSNSRPTQFDGIPLFL